MLRILTASSLLALAATPALAQQTDSMAAQPVPEAPVTAEAAPAPVSEPAPMKEGATATSAAPAAEPKEVTVAKLVDAEFPVYDANKNGDLDQPEFAKWVLALQAAGGGAQQTDAAAKAKWAKDAFTAADADKSKKVSKAEMNKFLLG
jgi:hypothetical protein